MAIPTLITAEQPDFVTRYVNLADEAFNAQVISCSDQWFAAANRMLQSSEPIFIDGKFDDHGKWMDGWETKRRRNGGHDHAIIKLGLAGIIRGLDLDTRYFTGNYPTAASVEACYCANDKEPDEQTIWTEILPTSSLIGDAQQFMTIQSDKIWTHLRLHIYPDGGIARFRVYGSPQMAIDDAISDQLQLIEASSIINGGRIVAFNNAHYGIPNRLIMPNRGLNMGDGWETRRRREPGFDWCIIALACPIKVQKIEIDTAHFKGNYPDKVSIQGAYVSHCTDQSLVTQAMFWDELLVPQKLEMDKQHFYEGLLISQIEVVSHVRVNIFPDGGLSRVRIWGQRI